MEEVTTETRKAFGPAFLISHAPQSPYMCHPAGIAKCGEDPCKTCGCSQAKKDSCGNVKSYFDIYKAVGKDINILNIQYYNTPGAFDAEFVIGNLKYLAEQGWDMGKVLVGKPSCSMEAPVPCASKGMYMDPKEISELFTQISGLNGNSGGMTWELGRALAEFGKPAIGAAMAKALGM